MIALLRAWSRSFERNRFVAHVFVSTPLALCAAQINFVCWVIVFFVGFWAFPYRARWTGEELEVTAALMVKRDVNSEAMTNRAP